MGKDEFMDQIIKKIKITYTMINEHETAESYIELPVEEDRYYALYSDFEAGSSDYEKVKLILENLTCLQGYDELGNFSLCLYGDRQESEFINKFKGDIFKWQFKCKIWLIKNLKRT